MAERRKPATMLLAFFCLVTSLPAQQVVPEGRTCQTTDLHEQLLQEDPDYRNAYQKRQEKFRNLQADRIAQPRYTLCPDPVLVPMAVHYSGVPNNPDIECLRQLAEDQIQILNDDYQGLNSDIATWINNSSNNYPGIDYGESCIQFCLATQDHPIGYNLNNGDPAVTINQVTGTENDWSGYINIFVRNISALGFSPLGGNGNGDGVTVDNNAFGAGAGCTGFVPGAPYNLGRTLTHELGHYLNLGHIWGGGCGSDDGVSDTPNQSGPNYGCPSSNTSSCSSLDLHMNYMDYTDDRCMYMFSAGQATIMENYLAAVLGNVTGNSAKCIPPAPALAFSAVNTQLTEGTSSCNTAGSQSVQLSIEIAAAPSATATVFIQATGSATNGSDYTISPNFLTFPAGQNDSRNFTITIMEDGETEADETIQLSFSVNPGGGNAVAGTTNQTHTVVIQDDDLLPAPNPEMITLTGQDFNNGLGSWQVVDGGSNSESWKLQSSNGGLDGSAYLIADSDAAGQGSTSLEQLFSPVFNGSSVSDLTLDFDQYINIYNGSNDYFETYTLDIWNGSAWVTIFSHDESDGDLGDWNIPNHQTIDLTAHAAPDNQLRFTYDARYDWWWALDNIFVTGIRQTSIQTAENAGGGFAERELGPNATVYFYDEFTGDVMLSITNASPFDYGCTSVYVERGVVGSPGATESSAPESRWLTDKTFRVIPEFDNPNGVFIIELYYTAAEIEGWAIESGEIIDDLQMVKSDGSIATATQLEVAVANQSFFGTDLIYSASFNSGFSGFALGGAAVLPVEWTAVSATPQEKVILVDWTTASESGNRGFEVVRSSSPGADDFEVLGWVDGQGDSERPHDYRFVDRKAVPGTRYFYQVRQIDYDGKSSFSELVDARIAAKGLQVSAFPNPVADHLTLNLYSPDEGSYQLMNAKGQLVITGDFGRGGQQRSLNTARLPSGIYWLRLTTAGEQQTKRIVVKR